MGKEEHMQDKKKERAYLSRMTSPFPIRVKHVSGRQRPKENNAEANYPSVITGALEE